MADGYASLGPWRKIATVDFYGRPHIIFMTNDDKSWGLGSHRPHEDEPKAPTSIRSIGNFDGIDEGFARDAKPIIEAALLDAEMNSDPSVSPNARPKAKAL